MTNFVITFPQRDKIRRDGWTRVIASDLEQVKEYADAAYGGGYSMIYREDAFNEGYYPHGCLEEVNLHCTV